MTFLLGSESCLRRLREDLREVEAAVRASFDAAGGGDAASWKYPGRSATDVDVAEVLEKGNFDQEDPEANTVTHVVLLELIIDRFYFMLQVHCQFIDKIISKNDITRPAQKMDKNTKNRTISPCLGITSKRHWNKMTQLSIFLNNLQKENIRQKNINKELLLEIESMKDTKCSKELVSLNTENISQEASSWLNSIDNERTSLKSAKKPRPGEISKDVGFKSSQTLDTVFKPCESCHISQSCFRETSSVLMKILKEESHTSSLHKLSQDLRSMDWLNDTKMMQLKDLFLKDLDKICHLYKDIRQKESKLSEDFSLSKKLCDQLKQELSQEKEKMNKERNELRNQSNQLELQIEVQNKNLKVTQTEIHSMTKDFNNKYKQIQKDMAEQNEQLLNKEKDIRQLETLKLSFMDFKLNAEDPLKCLSLIKDIIQKQKDEIESLNVAVENHKSTNSKFSEIEHNANEKENKLMKRLQNLSDQKHNVEEQIDLLENKLEIANTSIKALENIKASTSLQIKDKNSTIENLLTFKKEYNEKVEQLQSKISKMENTVLQLEKEKQLLINYPDLDGPLEKYDSGDVISDIKMQIKANAERIKLLSQHNTDLSNALTKLQFNVQYCSEASLEPDRLNDCSATSAASSRTTTQKDPELRLNISRPASNVVSSYSASRHKPPRPSTSSKSKVTDPSNNVLQWSTTTQKNVVIMPIVCDTCGRQYPQKSDLEIHKEYCAGRRRKVNQR